MKRIPINLIFFLLLPILGYSQSNFSIGGHLSTRINKIKLIDSQRSLGEPTQFGYGYSIGMQIQFTTKNNFFLRSGINYQRIKHQHREYWFRFALNGSDDPMNFVKRTVDVQSIVIPLEIGYLIKSKSGKVNFPLGIGGSLNFDLATKIDSKVVSAPYGETSNPNDHYSITPSIYSLVFFGGVEINLGEKMILGIEPNFRLTPNEFSFDRVNPKAETTYETGLTLRLRSK